MSSLLRRAVDVRPDELRALGWSFAYFFALLCAYYVLRPIRDALAITGGTEALPWLFTGTFLGMLAAVPAFGWVVKRYRRSRFIPYITAFFIANLAVFWALLESGVAPVHSARAFFIWTSVFNLFVVSVFWSFMADIFSNEQGKRLFGFIAAGGTAGTIVGPLVTLQLVHAVGHASLMLISAALLGATILCVRKLAAADRGTTAAAAHEPPAIGGGILAGITAVATSPYLLGICLLMILGSLTGTVLYFQQAEIVRDAFVTSDERTRMFAALDLIVSILTLATQLLATGRFIKRFGVAAALLAVPVVTIAGFALLAAAPTVGLLAAFVALRRTAEYAITKPGREVLYTVVPREQKYKAKNVMDTVVWRGGDAATGWIYNGARALGMDVAAIAVACIPIALAWAALAWGVGRAQDRRAERAPRLAPA